MRSERSSPGIAPIANARLGPATTRCSRCVPRRRGSPSGGGGALVLGSLLVLFAGPALAAAIVLNEYNAVGATAYLNGGDATTDEDGGVAADPFFGRVLGNGGDWFELVVIADHLDARGYKLDIFAFGVFDRRLELSSHALWSDLRAGTIITVAEDVPDDVSYDPAGGDYTINVQANDAVGVVTGGYVTPLHFPTNNNDWQLVIRDASESVVFGPAGEGVAPGIGVSNFEVFKLEAHPSILVTPASTDYEDGKLSTFGAPNVWGGGGSTQDLAALRTGPVGDRDGDGVPDDGDRSGIAGDAPCPIGQAAGCDDVCPVTPNPGQDPAACLCGDADGDGALGDSDVSALRGWLLRDPAASVDFGTCSVDGDGDCSIRDLVVLRRSLEGRGPALGAACYARAVPDDQTDLVFPPHRLLEVELTMAPADWDALRSQSRDVFEELGGNCMADPFTSPFPFHPASVKIDGQDVGDVGVRKKGFLGSQDSLRPSLKIDFSFAAGGRKFRGLSRLTLNNDKQDPSHVNQCLGYDLFRRAGTPAPRCSYAHVVVNGEDLGVYTHVESIKRPFLARHFPSTGGNLYEGTLSDFRDPWQNTFEQKTNLQDTLQADLDAIEVALQVPDASLENALGPLVDLDAFYSFWAVENLIGHVDGYQGAGNNFWLYFEPTSGQAHFIPWGIDTVLNGAIVLLGVGEPVPVLRPRMLLANRLYLNPPTRDAYVARLFQLLDEIWVEARLLNETDRVEALVSPAAGDIGAPVEARREFVRARRAEFEAAFASGPPTWTEPPLAPHCIGEAGTFSATCSTTFGSLGSLSGVGTLQIDYQGSLLAHDVEACGAGPDEGLPGLDTLRFAGLETDGDINVLNSIMHPTSMSPGVVPFIDTLSTLVVVPPSGPLTGIGLAIDGTLTFDQAGTSPGDPIEATAAGTIIDWVPLGAP